MLDISKIEALFEGIFPGLLGVKLQEATPEAVTATMKIRPELCAGRGSAHWGAVVGLAQTLGAVGAVLCQPENTHTRTVTSNTVFHADADGGTTIKARCVPREISETKMIWETQITNEDDELCAVVTQTQEILPED
jgi:uncharacterized protein (TIGR00369 family)